MGTYWGHTVQTFKNGQLMKGMFLPESETVKSMTYPNFKAETYTLYQKTCCSLPGSTTLSPLSRQLDLWFPHKENILKSSAGGTGRPCFLTLHARGKNYRQIHLRAVRRREYDRGIVVPYRCATQHPEPPSQYHILSICLSSLLLPLHQTP